MDRTWPRRRALPGTGAPGAVAARARCWGLGGVEREDVREGASRGVSSGERLAQVPLLPQGGDERGVAVLLVEDLALGDPGRHDEAGTR